jgi:hypothetical protein
MNHSNTANSVDIEVLVRACRDVLRFEERAPSLKARSNVRFISDLDVLQFDESKTIAEASLDRDVLSLELSLVSPAMRGLLRLPYRVTSGLLRPAIYALLRPLHRNFLQFQHSIFRMVLLVSRDGGKNTAQINQQQKLLELLQEEIRRQGDEIRLLRERANSRRLAA